MYIMNIKKTASVLLVASFGVLAGCGEDSPFDDTDKECMPYHVCQHPELHERFLKAKYEGWLRDKDKTWWGKLPSKTKLLICAFGIVFIITAIKKK